MKAKTAAKKQSQKKKKKAPPTKKRKRQDEDDDDNESSGDSNDDAMPPPRKRAKTDALPKRPQWQHPRRFRVGDVLYASSALCLGPFTCRNHKFLVVRELIDGADGTRQARIVELGGQGAYKGDPPFSLTDADLDKPYTRGILTADPSTDKKKDDNFATLTDTGYFVADLRKGSWHGLCGVPWDGEPLLNGGRWAWPIENCVDSDGEDGEFLCARASPLFDATSPLVGKQIRCLDADGHLAWRTLE